jgi:hypothetical protein
MRPLEHKIKRDLKRLFKPCEGWRWLLFTQPVRVGVVQCKRDVVQQNKYTHKSVGDLHLERYTEWLSSMSSSSERESVIHSLWVKPKTRLWRDIIGYIHTYVHRHTHHGNERMRKRKWWSTTKLYVNDGPCNRFSFFVPVPLCLDWCIPCIRFVPLSDVLYLL